MTMATVQFFRNPLYYPDYTDSLTPATGQINVTPKGTSMRGGSLHLSGEWGNLTTYNYIAIRRDGRTNWAWIDNITERTANSVIVDYTIDALRTYKKNVEIGNQFVVRSPTPNNKYDELLGSNDPAQTTDVTQTLFSNTMSRVLVVQTTSEPAWVANNTPVQPTPYHFYLIAYDPTNWIATQPIVDLINKLRVNPESQNIITMYSIPFMDLQGLEKVLLPLVVGDNVQDTLEGFYFLSGGSGSKERLKRTRLFDLPVPYAGKLSKVKHSVQIVIPEAGIINVPDDVLAYEKIGIRQDVDLFSGASNYMLVAGNDEVFTGVSVRGSSISSIPIISDPFETYISQNQNALATSLIGDVASLGIGAVSVATNPVMGGAMLSKGVGGLVGTTTGLLDQKSAIPSNPPAFLGTAMANDFHNKLFIITKYDRVTNQEIVQDTFGYPVGRVQHTTLPDNGFIQTQNCNIRSDGTVPEWAIEEINSRFDSGINVQNNPLQ